MNSRNHDIVRRDMEHVLHPTTDLYEHSQQGALVIERGEGVRVYDIDGRDYIEGMAGLWCAGLGFDEPELVRAAKEQLEALPFYHGFGGKAVLPVIDLAEQLKKISPFNVSKVFFTNSGSEANDTQIKLIWYYNNARGKPEKKKIISRWGAYHGVTIATGCLTGLPTFRNGFDTPLEQVRHVTCPHYYRQKIDGESEQQFSSRLAEELEQLILREGPETVAAFIAEPIMAGGGVIVPPDDYFPKIQAVLRKYDILSIGDEVVCGFGRTGNMFGSETVDFVPDTMTVAKQLSSAYMPIAAVMIPDTMYEVLIEASKTQGVFGHGITYGGHPVAAAVALRNLQLIEERNILGRVVEISKHFQARLHSYCEHPLVGEARGRGLIGALELVKDRNTGAAFNDVAEINKFATQCCQRNGLIIRFSGTSALFCPPMTISTEEIDELFDRFSAALDQIHRWLHANGKMK